MDEINVTVVEFGDRKFLQLQWKDPMTGLKKTKSSGTSNRREAQRKAAALEVELRRGKSMAKIGWAAFRDRCERERLAQLAPKTQDAEFTAFNHVERLLRPKWLADLTADRLSYLQAQLFENGLSPASVGCHLRHIRAALSWGVSLGMLNSVPKINMPRLPKGSKKMRGRPITTEEFERMLSATAKVRKRDAVIWQRFLNGLWLSGLRLGEAMSLSWDDHEAFVADLSGRHPRFRIWAEGEKGNANRLLPMTPDFAEFLLQTPEATRRGLVFPLNRKSPSKQISEKRVCRVVSSFGRKASVVTDKAKGRFATAHDLRRAFGTRWAPRVKPATLQQLMRHSSIQTTLTYYVALDADEIASELWQQHESSNTLGNSLDSHPIHAQEESRPNPGGSTA